MTAPALILLADGSADPKVAEIVHALRVGMQSMRSEVSVHVSFLDHCPPSGPQVISRLARQDVREVVFVPLNLSSVFADSPPIDAMVEKVRASHPQISFTVARPLGPEASLLTIVDARLRSALAARHVTELDGLVLATEGATDQRSQSLMARRARQWSLHHRLPVVVASAHESGPSMTQAIASLRAQGRRHIAVGSFLLTPGDAWTQQARAALRAGAVAVAAPLGAEEPVMDLAWGRYAVASMDLLDFGFAEATEETPARRHLHVVGA
ncbi:sirohydrochlorin chelatase [Mariniluteicoccus endophyticus]